MKIGIFLGSNPDFGGIFQYTISILDALLEFKDPKKIKVFYVGKNWESILSRYPFEKRKLPLGSVGVLLSNIFLFLKLSGKSSRVFTSFLNPIAWVLNNEPLDYLIFPAQDAISYQVKSNAVITIHDLMHVYESRFPEVSESGRKEIRDHRFSNIAAYARIILVDSEIGKQQVIDCYGVNAAKVFSLPYIPHKELTNVKEEKISLKGIQLPQKYFFYPAQFWAHKNHKNLIQALWLAQKNYPDMSIIFSGGKSREYESLVRLVNELKLTQQVYFVGYLTDSDLVYLYKQARAMIMPTFFGPTNIPPLEALLFDCPVAVSKIYGMPEQLGEASLYFNPNDVGEMSNVLEQLWHDDDICQKLIKAGRKKTVQWNLKSYSNRLQMILGNK